MKIYQVDAFASKPFSGNPAAVCILENEKSEEWMQALAEEMNLSETAFLEQKGDAFNLRWFTPNFEVDLCGHATLASAHILWETGLLNSEQNALFHTKSGTLTARNLGSGIELNFPAEIAEPCELPAEIARSLGVNTVYTGQNRMDYLVELESAEALRNLKPDFNIMGKVNTRGVIVTSKSDVPEYDFLSRFFAPWHGIDEDPVTGSAHCCTGPYWREKLGLEELRAFQASPRGGEVNIGFKDERILLSGKAITILKGELLSI
ncbi:MAG: PhzF family phenazine biosynthesis protein [Flavobacteriales bacterium]|nr:PhzF family phenazine biosynthesis protein [Flavobacteriales bacterium]